MFVQGIAELGNIEGATVIGWKVIRKALESDLISRLGIEASVVKICVNESDENNAWDLTRSIFTNTRKTEMSFDVSGFYNPMARFSEMLEVFIE